MAKEKETRERFSLGRWSRRKLAAAKDSKGKDVPATQDATRAAMPAQIDPVARTSAEAAAPAIAPGARIAEAQAQLPSIDSLTFDSDYSQFMKPGVDESLRQGALKKLLRDPHFNVMDGLDVYIDDYTKPSPLDADTAKAMVDRLFASTQPPSAETKRDPDASTEAAGSEQAVSTQDVQPHAAADDASTPATERAEHAISQTSSESPNLNARDVSGVAARATPAQHPADGDRKDPDVR
jgi:hypothetical protein